MDKYVSYKPHFKLKVVAFARENGKRATGRKFKVDEKCVCHRCLQEGSLRKTKQTKSAFRGKRSMFPEAEELLLQYVTDTRSNGYVVSTKMLRLKALEIERS